MASKNNNSPDIPETMSAVLLTGHGNTDKLTYSSSVPVPTIDANEVLIKVLAAAVNNTDINTRLAWYSKTVSGATDAVIDAAQSEAADEDGGWSGEPISFPRIQGADCCGEIVATGSAVNSGRIGERVLVRALQSTGAKRGNFQTWTFGSECDGAFAEYTKTFAQDALTVNSAWSHTELASIPCAYSTAEGMLQRASVGAERILITGASGGVGAAAIQLAKCRGAHVTAQTSAAKVNAIRNIGADEVVLRADVPEKDSYDVVVDLVAGPAWPTLIDSLRRGGRYVVAGAIAGPIVELDVRTLYLRDLSFFGTTFQSDSVLPSVITRIEKHELTPLIASSFPLKNLVAAQTEFLTKQHIGKIVIEI